MEHYICTGGCGGVSPVAGVCQAEDCPRKGMPLEACDCTDGNHHGRQEKDAGSTDAAASEKTDA